MKNFIKKLLVTSLLLSSSLITNADDTDIIDVTPPVDSNVLFVMDMSGSMRKELNSENTAALYEDSRSGVLHAALRTVLNDPALADINVGLATFSGDTGTSAANQVAHGISYPVSPIFSISDDILNLNSLWNHKSSIYDGETVISYLPIGGARTTAGYIGDAIPTTWTPSGGTPIVDALYEAALYFRARTVDWGEKDPSHVQSAHPSSYTGLLYNKTAPSVTPVLQSCGRSAQPVCNGTETIPCPIITQTVTCDITDTACVNNATANGYLTCDAPVSNSGSYSCDINACNNNAGCNSGNPNTHVNHGTCELGSAAACYADGWDSGSCSPDTIPESTVQGPCITWNDAGACTGYGPDITTPEHTVYNCTKTTTTYNCPWSNTTQTCSREVDNCQHDTYPDVTTLEGTAVYNSPITEECANNSIVLLSDGRPTLARSADRVTSLIGVANANGCSAGGDPGRCGNELTKYLSNEDNSTTVAGDQFITTHTIGIALTDVVASAYLEDLAFNGGGQFVNANSSAGLIAALTNALTSTAKAHSFTSPTYTTTASSLSTGEYVYLPVFDRSLGSLWTGNLKKYKRDPDDGRLIDADSINATDPLGTLKDTARDFWSVAVSTSSVKSGGVANKIDPATRRAFTDNGSNGTAANLIPLNNSIPNAKFGATVTSAYKDQLVDFILGKKADGTPRHHLGDIIHSKPVYLSYGANTVLFVGTNEGYLHAFDESTGEELFAFMPSDLLKNIDIQFRNDAADTHAYGVDGEITLNHDDANNNKIVDSGEKVILYFGLRRGGKSYYALDVTNRLNPDLKWKISNTGVFSALGYTWSPPVVAEMIIHPSTVPTTVLVFGGGYIDDNGIDGPVETDNGTTTTGSGVYIVGANDGSFKWKTSSVNYAVPARIRVSDINGDGMLDRLYFGDTGGNVWRVDLTRKFADAKVMHFADLSGATNRKFFAEPDIAIFKKGGGYLISVALGSGERPKPLDSTNDDKFFVMFDKNAIGTPTVAPAAIVKADLVDASSGPVTNALAGGNKGWYTDLDDLVGEKVLSSALTYDGVVLFNSFGVTSVTASACGSNNVNRSRFYALDLFTGGPVVDLDEDGTIDASTEIGPSDSIPSTPTITSNPPQKGGGGGCTQGDCNLDISYNPSTGGSIKARVTNPLRRVYWIDEE